jgi:hypothetical protein
MFQGKVKTEWLTKGALSPTLKAIIPKMTLEIVFLRLLSGVIDSVTF